MRAMANFAPRPVSCANAGPRPSRQLVPAASELGSGASSSTGGRGAVEPARQRQPDSAEATPSRRAFLLGAGGAAALAPLLRPSAAAAESGLGRYIKRKKLDPLDTYVPLVLQAQEQLLSLKGTVVDDASGARASLRSGAFNGLRDNVRALGEYAVTNGAAADAGALVNGFFQKIEAFDLILYRAVQDGSKPDGPKAEAGLQASADALAALIATVPADVLARARAVLDKANGKAGGDGAAAAAGAAAAGAAAEAGVEQSAEDVELLQELLTVWE